MLLFVEGWLATDYGASGTNVRAGRRDEQENTRILEVRPFSVKELGGGGASGTKLECACATIGGPKAGSFSSTRQAAK